MAKLNWLGPAGAIVGVGLLEGKGGVNWKQFGKQFIAWMCTLAVVGLLTAAVFSQVPQILLLVLLIRTTPSWLWPISRPNWLLLCPYWILCVCSGVNTTSWLALEIPRNITDHVVNREINLSPIPPWIFLNFHGHGDKPDGLPLIPLVCTV